ncbi:MAG: capsular polysaccharide biosynthesis protein CapF [Eubacteriales bacterium]|jgi:UDP-2-acetamido-2,6-beta-L-arabino-hexul-4-ose reductase
MNVLVTGSKGFIGKNLVATLKNIIEGKERKYDFNSKLAILEYDVDADPRLLEEYCRKCDFVINLAGVNRPDDEAEYMPENFGFISTLIDTLMKYDNHCPVMFASSTQAVLDNPYGKSKKAGEDLVFKYASETGAEVYIYRLPNVFGKWCRPNYNSAIATFCFNIARGQPIKVSDRNVRMNLVYIDDVVEEFVNALSGKANKKDDGYCYIPVKYTATLGEIVDLIYSFRASREELDLPDLSDALTKKLYATYISYLPENQFSYPLKMNTDSRGSFTEIIRTPDRGQFSVNISKPGVTKGNHWHNTKFEKFLVVSGKGVIRFRKIDEDRIHEYYVDCKKLEVVDIPTGYTHSIENLGDTDMVTLIWANECYDPEKPDTFYLEV